MFYNTFSLKMMEYYIFFIYICALNRAIGIHF